MCTHFLHHIHLLASFPHYLPPSTGSSPPPLAGLVLLFSDFVKEKEKR
jgi:hypothetical protein